MQRLWSLLVLWCCLAVHAPAQSAPPVLVAPGVWFLLGDAHAGYCNTVIIEMDRYLVVVDGSYPGRAHELLLLLPTLSSKPVRYVFDTHAHGDHAYGNSVWTAAGAITLATKATLEEMDRYEPTRWQTAMLRRDDVRATHEVDAQRPRQTFPGSKFTLHDGSRTVEFVNLGWAHTRGDGWVWLPKERILCTGDAAVNGPRNKLWDADIANWPRVLDRALQLRPLHVLPGHGERGGAEILAGQAKFLRDLLAAAQAAVQRHDTLEQAQRTIHLPADDANWIPADMSGDVEAAFREAAEGKPMGALPHIWR